MGKKYDVSWAPGGRIGYLVDGEPEGKEAMKIEVRCTSVRVVPSDASGFIVDAEVADRTEVIRQAIHEMTEAEIDNAFGKENADRAADEARRAIDRGLKQAALESENAKLKEESREFRGMDASVGIADPCPSCGQKKLFVGTGGYLTCSGSKCKAPCAIGDVAKDNANLRDLLRRVRGCFRNGETPATIAIELSTLMPEIKAAIEPAGEATS